MPDAAYIMDVYLETTDEELLLRYRDLGDQQAFEELVQRYERELYNYLYRYVGNASLAEDLFQSTFLRVHEKCNEYTEGRRVRPWIYSIATHLAIDALRKAGRRHAVSLETQSDEAAQGDGAKLIDLIASEAPGPVQQLEDSEWRDWAQQAVERLPEHLRLAILLVYFQGLKYSEAAEVLGVPLGTVKSRLHAALVKLHDAWKNENPRLHA